MFRISEKELKDLRERHKKLLKFVSFKNGENPAREWSKFRSPLRQALNYAVVELCKLLQPCELKNGVYRAIGATIGKNVSIANDCILDTIFPELIVLDDNVTLGWGTKLYTHEFTQTECRIGSIILEKGAMLGEWSVVRPGTTIGKGSLIAAMSFVNHDVEPGLREGGVPIHLLRHLQKHVETHHGRPRKKR